MFPFIEIKTNGTGFKETNPQIHFLAEIIPFTFLSILLPILNVYLSAISFVIFTKHFQHPFLCSLSDWSAFRTNK